MKLRSNATPLTGEVELFEKAYKELKVLQYKHKGYVIYERHESCHGSHGGCIDYENYTGHEKYEGYK